MRLEGQMKGGFYPAPDEAVDMVLERLTAEDGARIFDPCAGKGEAIGRIADKLAVRRQNVYAIELEKSRASAIGERLAGGNILAPCDFFQSEVSAGKMGLVWCNPPYDNEIGGGGRVEMSFLDRATRCVATKGIIALVCPGHVASRIDVRTHLLECYEQVSVMRFPEYVREYDEVVVLGVKRPRATIAYAYDWLERTRHNGGVSYTVPATTPPGRFAKVGLTVEEVEESLSSSPLNSVWKGARKSEMPSPPLELARGQLALVLAGGMLNTVLQKPGERPILIKATPYKEDYVSSVTEEVKTSDEGEQSVETTTIVSQRIKLKIRVLDAMGRIHELTE